jgi:hypothetical protein
MPVSQSQFASDGGTFSSRIRGATSWASYCRAQACCQVLQNSLQRVHVCKNHIKNKSPSMAGTVFVESLSLADEWQSSAPDCLSAIFQNKHLTYRTSLLPKNLDKEDSAKARSAKRLVCVVPRTAVWAACFIKWVVDSR